MPNVGGRLDRRVRIAQFALSEDSVPQATNHFAGLIGRGLNHPARITNRPLILRFVLGRVESPKISIKQITLNYPEPATALRRCRRRLSRHRFEGRVD